MDVIMSKFCIYMDANLIHLTLKAKINALKKQGYLKIHMVTFEKTYHQKQLDAY